MWQQNYTPIAISIAASAIIEYLTKYYGAHSIVAKQ